MKRVFFFLLICAFSAAASEVAGRWDVKAQSPGGRQYKLELELTAQGDKLSGSMSSTAGSVPLEEVLFSGNQLTYKFSVNAGVYVIKLALENGVLKGTYTTPDGTSGPVVASRAAANADFAGKWIISTTDPDGNGQKLGLTLKEEAGALAGSLLLPDGLPVPLAELKRDGSELTFKVTVEGAAYSVKLALDQGSLKGSYTGPSGSGHPILATR